MRVTKTIFKFFIFVSYFYCVYCIINYYSSDVRACSNEYMDTTNFDKGYTDGWEAGCGHNWVWVPKIKIPHPEPYQNSYQHGYDRAIKISEKYARRERERLDKKKAFDDFKYKTGIDVEKLLKNNHEEER